MRRAVGDVVPGAGKEETGPAAVRRGAEVDFVADIERVEDADDAERRGVEDADGGAGVDGLGRVAGVNSAGRDAGRDGRSRPCVLCRSGTVAPMQ